MLIGKGVITQDWIKMRILLLIFKLKHYDTMGYRNPLGFLDLLILHYISNLNLINLSRANANLLNRLNGYYVIHTDYLSRPANRQRILRALQGYARSITINDTELDLHTIVLAQICIDISVWFS